MKLIITIFLCLMSANAIVYALPNLNDIVTSLSQIKDKKKSSINLSKDYVFVIFFRGDCVHCQRFAPVIKQFTEDYHVVLYPVSVNQQSIAMFNQSINADKQLIDTYFPSGNVVVPALFLLNKNNNHAYTVTIGELSYADLQDRVSFISKKIMQLENDN